MTCSACLEGELHEQLVTTWLRRGSRWVEVRGVRALVCDECEREFFDQEVGEQLRRVADPANFVRRIDTVSHDVVDLRVGNIVQPLQGEFGTDFGDADAPPLRVQEWPLPPELLHRDAAATEVLPEAV